MINNINVTEIEPINYRISNEDSLKKEKNDGAIFKKKKKLMKMHN